MKQMVIWIQISLFAVFFGLECDSSLSAKITDKADILMQQTMAGGDSKALSATKDGIGLDHDKLTIRQMLGKKPENSPGKIKPKNPDGTVGEKPLDKKGTGENKHSTDTDAGRQPDTTDVKKQKPAQEKLTTYITGLPFRDARTKTILVQSQYSIQICDAVVEGLKRIIPASVIKYNEPGRCIPATDENVELLFDIVYNPGATPDMNMKQIIKQFMEPYKVDVIIFGQYIDQESSINVKPIAVFRKENKFATKSFIFSKEEYLCPDQSDIKTLCTGAQKISMEVVEKMEDKISLPTPQKVILQSSPRSVSVLAPSENQTTGLDSAVFSCIFDAMVKGTIEAAKNDLTLKFDAKTPIIKNSRENLDLVNTVLHDMKQPFNEKLAALEKKLMGPKGVDLLITGLYSDNDSEVVLKPIVIDQHQKAIFGKLLIFSKKEFMHADPSHPEKFILSKDAENKISETTRLLLQQLN